MGLHSFPVEATRHVGLIGSVALGFASDRYEWSWETFILSEVLLFELCVIVFIGLVYLESEVDKELERMGESED
jgi:hypothetical protein